MEAVGRTTFSGSWQEARDTLREWRTQNVRKSCQTIELGSTLLRHKASKLGSELWTVHEQVCVAALDCGDHETAKYSLEALKKQFPSSIRVLKLEGMCLEAEGKFDKAMVLYDSALKDHETNADLSKRKICVLKAQGKVMEAIAELNKLLKVYMSDTESWMELANLYVQVNDYHKAGFCWEELILANPHHHLYHQRFAEVSYTEGSMEGLELARKHFATALKLNSDNVRALYGLCWVCHTLNSRAGKPESKTKNSRYMDWAKSQLKLVYQDSEKLRLVERMLDSTK